MTKSKLIKVQFRLNFSIVSIRKVLKEVSVGDMQPDDTVESVHEANLLSKLDHPYIVKYHDSFLDGEYFCIVTEYCEVCALAWMMSVVDLFNLVFALSKGWRLGYSLQETKKRVEEIL